MNPESIRKRLSSGMDLIFMWMDGSQTVLTQITGISQDNVVEYKELGRRPRVVEFN